MRRRHRVFMLGAMAVAIAVVTACLPRIPQDPAYHQFADQRAILGLPHFWNVVSNLALVVAGAQGLLVLRRRERSSCAAPDDARAWRIFFLGALLTGWGSAWYHLAPGNERLVWDRLPITVSFMAFLAAIAGERLSPVLGRRLLGPLVAAGIISVIYWIRTERAGAGDLRPYGFVQFAPAILIPALILLFPSRTARANDLWVVMGFYVLAKLGEWQDRALFDLGQVLSGHTLKHLAAGLAVHGVSRMIRLRGPQAARNQPSPTI